MQGMKDIFGSERGVFVVALLALVTLLVLTGHVSSADWLDYTKWIAVTFIAGKTVSHAVEAMRPSSTITAWTVPPAGSTPTTGATITERLP